MDYLEQDDSMPAFIRDVKAYSEKQFKYHSQHSAEIREIKAQNKVLINRISLLEDKLTLLTNKIN